MDQQQLHDELRQVARELRAVRGKIESLAPHLRLMVDQKAVRGIMTDLAWAIENCTVVALHQIGEAMEDAMGITDDGKVR